MKRIFPLIFTAGAALVFLTPMELGDFWWHLSTGQWILSHGGLPAADPFSITSTPGRDVSFVLRGFWLSQVLYAALHWAAGIKGIIALKAALFGLSFLLVARTARHLGLGSPMCYVISAPLLFVGTFYDESRPQTFSFLFFALLILILETGRQQRLDGPEAEGPMPRAWFALPPLMLVWANMHPGFVIGFALIAAYLAETAAAWALSRKAPSRHAAGFVLLCCLGLGLSALNPNGLEALGITFNMLMTSIKGAASIHEHMPLKDFSEFTRQEGLQYAIKGFIAAGALSFALRWRRADLLHLAVFAVLAFLSLQSFRGGMFFSIFCTAVVARNLSALRSPAALEGTAARWALAAALLPVAFVLLVPRTIIKEPLLVRGIFPDKAAAHIEAAALPGNVYHPYEWGGYLIWRLYPGYKAYIDGRAIGSIKEHTSVLQARAGWDETLRRNDVNTVLFWARLPFTGSVPPIIFALIKHEGWSPVYWDTTSLIFVRAPLARNTIRKSAVWELLTSLLSTAARERPSVASLHTALGEVYLHRGLRQYARDEFSRALALDPGQSKAAYWLSTLK